MLGGSVEHCMQNIQWRIEMDQLPTKSRIDLKDNSNSSQGVHHPNATQL